MPLLVRRETELDARVLGVRDARLAVRRVGAGDLVDAAADLGLADDERRLAVPVREDGREPSLEQVVSLRRAKRVVSGVAFSMLEEMMVLSAATLRTKVSA